MKREQAPYTLIDPALVERVAQGVRETIEQARGSVSGNGPLPVTWFGPGKPIRPVAPPDVKGRAFDFPYAINAQIRPRAYEGITFDQLRTLADNYDLLRLCIETRKDQMSKLTFSVMPRLKHGEQVRPKADERCAEIEEFFQRPDRKHSWDAWMRMLVEDQIVIDAPAIYCRRNLAGRPWALEVVDGATIKPLLDEWGRQPEPPVPAYQQVLKGLPAVNYTADELIYAPRNPRPHRVYGYGPVEQIIATVNIGLRRQLGQMHHFTEGNIPEGLIGVPESWTPDQIRMFEDRWNAMLENPALRRKVKFVPAGTTYQPTRNDAMLVDQFDEWLARIVCYALSLPPLPFVKMINRSVAETSYESALKEGLEPMMAWLKDVLDDIIGRWFGYPDLEIVWDNYLDLKPEEKLQQNAMAFRTGFKSLDKCLIEAGEDPVGVDEPIVFGVGPMGFMFASDLVRAKKLGLTMPQMGMAGPGVPGGELPPGAMPGAGGDPVQQIEGLLAGVDPAILEAVGLASPAEVQQNDAYDTGYEEGVADAQADAQAVSMPVGSTLPASRPIVQIADTLRGAERTLKQLARTF